MNKTKKQLYEENKRLKKERKMYREFWEIDLLDKRTRQLSFIMGRMWILAILLLCVSCFLIGIMCS